MNRSSNLHVLCYGFLYVLLMWNNLWILKMTVCTAGCYCLRQL